MIIKIFFTTKIREEIHMIVCLLKTYNVPLTLGQRNECFLLSSILLPLIFVNYLFFFSLNVSESAVLRKPNVYREIAVSKFICACIITGGS